LLLYEKPVEIKCSVEGCGEKVTTSLGKGDEFHFCRHHNTAWGYFHRGFYAGRGFGVDGLVRRKVWDEAMREFLEHCWTEIIALEQLGATKDTSLEELYRWAGR